MTEPSKRATVYFDSELHRALRMKAADAHRSVSDLVNEAVHRALNEDREDIAASESRVAEPTISYEALKQTLESRKVETELIKLSKKGQLTIPRELLRQVGIESETPLLAETRDDGTIVLRQAAVYPLENYSEARIREFEETNKVPSELLERVQERIDGK